jgi:hypothetical protein
VQPLKLNSFACREIKRAKIFMQLVVIEQVVRDDSITASGVAVN